MPSVSDFIFKNNGQRIFLENGFERRRRRLVGGVSAGLPRGREHQQVHHGLRQRLNLKSDPPRTTSAGSGTRGSKILGAQLSWTVSSEAETKEKIFEGN